MVTSQGRKNLSCQESGRFNLLNEYLDYLCDSIQVDHVHLIIVIPPRYAVSAIVEKIKANTSRAIRKEFEWIKKIYWRNEFWSPGFFSSTVGINEAIIKRYVEFQEKIDKEQLKLGF